MLTNLFYRYKRLSENSMHLFGRVLSVMLSFVLVFNIFSTVQIVRADEVVYPIPTLTMGDSGANILIDASTSGDHNEQWFTGYSTDISTGTQTVLARYSGYGLTVVDITAGLGTQSHPYIIETGLELAYLATLVNSGNSFSGKYISVVGSRRAGLEVNPSEKYIDLIGKGGILYQSGTDTVSWLATDSIGNLGWEPIGNTQTSAFCGNITVASDVKIYNLSAYINTKKDFGLFGYTGDGAKITGFNLVDTMVYSAYTASQTTATLIGRIVGDTTVTNCSVSGIARGTDGKRMTYADGTAVTASADGNSYGYYIVPDFTVGVFNESVRSPSESTVSGLIGNCAAGTISISGITLDTVLSVQCSCASGGAIGTVSSTEPVTITGVTGSNLTKTYKSSESYFYRAGGIVGDYSSVASTSTLTISAIGGTYSNGTWSKTGTEFKSKLNGLGKTESGSDATLGGFGGIIGFYGSTNKNVSNSSASLYIDNSFVEIQARISKYDSGNNNFYFGGILGRARTKASGTSNAILSIDNCHVGGSSYYKRFSNYGSETIKITFGGVIGGVNAAFRTGSNANSNISNCTVTDLLLSCDGFAGGIVGLGTSGSGCNIRSITDCTVTNLRIIQSTWSTTKTLWGFFGGIVAATDANTAQISRCNVVNLQMSFLFVASEKLTTAMGGLVGKSVCSGGTATINDCTSQAIVRIGSTTTNLSGIVVGGLVGYASNTVVTNCASAMDFKHVGTITNSYDPSQGNDVVFTAVANGGVLENAVVGGIFGVADNSTSASKSFSSGNIDVSIPSEYTVTGGKRQNSAGGLAGVVKGGETVTFTDCFSTASVNANLQDAAGGLVGYNSNLNASFSNCHYGGALLNPYTGSILGYSAGGTFAGITHDKRYSPNSTAILGEVSGVTSTTSFSSSFTPASPTSYFTAFYQAATAEQLFSNNTINGNHVFAVTSALTGGAISEVRTLTGVSQNSTVSIERKVKLVHNNINNAQDGLDTPYTIASSTDLVNMQSYVAAGGGFLGSRFNATADFSSALAVPIGMASADLKTAADDDQPFCGIFDGNAHVITLTADRSEKEYNGLFGYVQNSKIGNFTLIFSGARSISATGYSGGVAGYAAYSSFSDISVKALEGLSVTHLATGGASGGIVGFTVSSNNSNTVTVSSFTGKLIGGSNLGGIVGANSNAIPSFVFSTSGHTNSPFATYSSIYSGGGKYNFKLFLCRVSGDIIGGASQTGSIASNSATAVGGIIGNSCGGSCQILKSYVFGNVTGSNRVGGLVGNLSSAISIAETSYFNGDIYANNFAGGIIGYVVDASNDVQLVNVCYFVGQLECNGAKGALTSSNGLTMGFAYDIQVAGNLPVTGNVEDSSESEYTTDSFVEGEFSGSSGNVIDYQATMRDFIPSTINSTSKAVSGQTYTYSPDPNGTTDDISLTLSGTWEYNLSNLPSSYTYPLLDTVNTNRVNADLSSPNGGAYAEYAFTGNYFELYDIMSGGHCAYKVYIDGTLVSGESLEQVSGIQYEGSVVVGAGSAHVTVYSSQTPSDSYTVSSYGGSSFTTNTAALLMRIDNLAVGTHTVRIKGVEVGTRRYLNMRGVKYGTNYDFAFSNSFYITAENYPQITEFSTNYPAQSLLSTERIYDFTANAENTAHTFLPSTAGSNTVTVFDTYMAYGTSDKTYTVLNAGRTMLADMTAADSYIGTIGVTRTPNSDVYLNTGLTGQINEGNFYYRTTRTIDGYALSINERIIVEPFTEGVGTQDNPFEIRNVQELKMFRNFINNVYGGDGLYFKLTMTTTTSAHSADGTVYDLTGTDEYHDSAYETATDWNTPIGTQASKFQGNFDGNGKKIIGLNIDALRIDAAGNGLSAVGYGGLFGYVSDGNIYDLTVEANADYSTNSVTASDKFFGGIVGVLDNAELKNCTVKSEITVTGNTSADKIYLAGGAVGRIIGNSTLDGVLSDSNITVKSAVRLLSNYFGVGLLAGGQTLKYNNARAKIQNCVSYGSITEDATVAKATRVSAGGLVGVWNGTNASGGLIDVTNNAVYGSAKAVSGNVGSIYGNIESSWYCLLNIANNLSTMTLTVGDSEATTESYNLGGMFGKATLYSDNLTISNNVFGGEMNAICPASLTFNVGGFAGSSNVTKHSSDLSTENWYDKTKNPGLKQIGTSNLSFFSNSTLNGAKTTAELISGNTGNYIAPSFPAEITFGSQENLVTAAKITEGNAVSLNLVRVDAVNSGNDPYMSLTSSFVSSASNKTLQIANYNSSSAFYKAANVSQTGGYTKRAVSVATSNDTVNAVTVQVVRLEGGTDVLSGYGKKLVYLPSILSVGKTDASYMEANPEGDKLSSASGISFTIYNEDQLMGLETLVSEMSSDTFGNWAASVVTGSYAVCLKNNCDYSSLDYTGDEDNSNVFIIGDSTHPFTGIFNGGEHIVSGMTIISDDTDVGLFACADGVTVNGTTTNAKINSLGITDSVFARTGSGNIGSFFGSVSDTDFTDCFSSARVEQGDTAPDGVYIGGFSGIADGGSVSDSFFTGSVGITAADAASYPSVTGSGIYYAGGMFGEVTKALTVTGSYVASYVHGDVTPELASTAKPHNIGQFVAKGGSFVAFDTVSADYQAGAEGCYALGDRTSVVVSQTAAEDYPSVWTVSAQTVRERAARKRVSFSSSASSMSRAEVTGAVFSTDPYGIAYAVYGTQLLPFYTIAEGASTLTRTNSGISSVAVVYTADGVTSKRLVEMSLQCWYDNFLLDDNGNKVYTLKNASDLAELAQMVRDGNDSSIGHTHSVAHTGTGIAGDRFATAVIKLGNNITAAEKLEIIGQSQSAAFAGTFDGNGYTVSNASFESSGGRLGMFGYLADTAVIKNLTMAGDSTLTVSSDETGTIYGGGIVADNTRGNIINCANLANITLVNNSSQNVYFGGITGAVGNGKTLRHCYNMGHITAGSQGMYIAGIVGTVNSGGTVDACYNTGIIDGYFESGVANFVTSTYVAGICSANSGMVSDCYNAGILRYAIRSDPYPVSDGTVSASYADARYFKLGYQFNAGETVHGAKMIATESMSAGTAFENSWTDYTYTAGYYPQFTEITSDSTVSGLRRQASSKVSALAGILSIDDETAPTFDRFTDIEFVYGTEPVTVTRNENNIGKFSVRDITSSENITGQHMAVTKKGAAMVYVSMEYGDTVYRREIYYVNEDTFTVSYMFDFGELTNDAEESKVRPVSEYMNGSTKIDTFADSQTRATYGIGTAKDPYVINTASDFIAFANYINGSNAGGRERYFELASDIDFNGRTFIPVGTESRSFEGVFSGNGHILSGITTTTNIKYNGVFGNIGSGGTVQMLSISPTCMFNVQTGNSLGSWTGAIAGYCAGVISNCFSRAVVRVPAGNTGVMYVGGIAGELAENAIIKGCYVRPASQNDKNVPDDKNTISNYSSSSDLVCGILVGKTRGIINGCYHTCVYYIPSGYTPTMYGIIAGDFVGGNITNTYYDASMMSQRTDVPLFKKYLGDSNGITVYEGNRFAKTTEELKTTEKSATTNGIANDSMALLLSENIYLGTYEMTALPYHSTFAGRYSNDGYPMLTAFDLAQFDFVSFETSNLILCMQNVDVTEDNRKLMNALCSYKTYDFPVYADIIAKTLLNVNVYSLPDNISYNVSAVGYGTDNEGSEIKWTADNGIYTVRNQLTLDIIDPETNEVLSTGHGSQWVAASDTVGSMTINFGLGQLPSNCDKLYVYITLVHDTTPVNKWGVYHDWDSSTLQPYPDDEEE